MSDVARLSPQLIVERFAEDGFVCDEELATVLFLAERMEKPLLIEGPPGVGKTEVAKLWAGFHDARLIRLQCYEGLDESRALYEWSYGKQMLYAQLLRDKTSELVGDAGNLDQAVRRLADQADAFFSESFLVPRPLLAAIRSPEPVVLLIDEIDRADEEFEAFLLELLSDFQVTVPELGTLRALQRPRVILTSNDVRELSDALRRRCLYLYVDYPDERQELEIVARRVPQLEEGLRRRAVEFIHAVRRSALRKQPGVAETIDWALALVAMGADGLTPQVLRRTLGALLKNRDDLERVLEQRSRLQR